MRLVASLAQFTENAPPVAHKLGGLLCWDHSGVVSIRGHKPVHALVSHNRAYTLGLENLFDGRQFPRRRMRGVLK